MKSYVIGKSTGPRMRTSFLKDVDTLYVPMKWGNTHWVGLVISLEVLDPFIAHTTHEEASRFMGPMIECIPWVLKCCLPKTEARGIDTTPYGWVRQQGVFQNKRAEDCGVVVAKFLEMRAAGLGAEELGKLTDEDVDRYREKYAMDSYEQFVAKL